MKYDFKVKEIIQEIKEDYAKEGVILTDEDIFTMCNTQFKALNFAVKKGIDIRLPIFGTFMRKRVNDIIQSVMAVKALENTLSENDFNKAIVDAKLRRLEREAKLKKDKKTVQTLDELAVLRDFKHQYKEEKNFVKLLKNE